MPIFEYRCMVCRKVFEQFTQRPHNAQAPSCPACGAVKTERVLSAFSGRVNDGGCGSQSSNFG